MRQKIFIFISFICVLVSLVSLSFAWFSKNESASANHDGINTDDISATVSLEAYMNNTWDSTNDIIFEDIFPSDTLYFRFKIETEKSVNLTYLCEGITTSIYGLSLNDDKSGLLYEDVLVYDVTNNEVSVEANNETVILYTISDDTININSNYTLDKALKLYPLGVSSSEITSITDGVEGQALSSSITINDILGECYYYFAIKYEETDLDNLYQFQKIVIDHIKITEV